MRAGIVVGIISDTHGRLRNGVDKALSGVAFILHAGDVGGDDVLDELGLIAPTYAVQGNCDGPGDPRLVAAISRDVGGLSVHVSHGHELGVPTVGRLLAVYDADVVVYGHTHRPLVHRAADGRLVVNPGAAGPPRFDIAPSVARMTIEDGRAGVELIALDG